MVFGHKECCSHPGWESPGNGGSEHCSCPACPRLLEEAKGDRVFVLGLRKSTGKNIFSLLRLLQLAMMLRVDEG